MFKSGLSSFSSGGVVTIVGGESLVSNGEDDSMSTGSSSGGSWLVLSLASGSGGTTGVCVSLIGGRGIFRKRWR